MNHFYVNEDILSPIRFDTSLADVSISENLSNVSNDPEFSCVDFSKNKASFELPDMMSVKKKNGMRLEPEPATSNQNVPEDCSSMYLKTQTFAQGKGNGDKNSFKIRNTSKAEASNSYKQDVKISQEKGKSISKKNTYSGQTELKAQKPPRPASLQPSKIEISKCNRDKNKKETFNMSDSISKECSKSFELCTNDSIFYPQDNLKKEKSLDPKKKYKNTESVRSVIQSTEDSNVVKYDILNTKSSSLTHCKQTLKSANHSQYEISVERIVRDHVSFECDKIRQNFYMQQMSFCRQINKIKDEMEHQHSATIRRLYKFAEELMELNTILKDS